MEGASKDFWSICRNQKSRNIRQEVHKPGNICGGTMRVSVVFSSSNSPRSLSSAEGDFERKDDDGIEEGDREESSKIGSWSTRGGFYLSIRRRSSIVTLRPW